jgi:hypothetical protein
MLLQTIITIIGIFVLFFYTVTKLFGFYGVGAEWYGVYMAFYGFILVSLAILPRKIPNIVAGIPVFANVGSSSSSSLTDGNLADFNSL